MIDLAPKNYGLLENKVIQIVQTEGQFIFERETYIVIKVGKPRPQAGSGEPKTDVYIIAECNERLREFKISVKSRNTNEFQENKVTAERAENLLGPDYEDIIEKSTRNIEDRFNEFHLLYASGRHPRKPNSVTIGWKLEIADKERILSAPLQLSDQEVRDNIYKGVNLREEKRNAQVNGEVIENSGIAEYMLYKELTELQTTADIFNNIQLIDEVDFAPLWLIFTANNYRTAENKTDGDRALAVRVHWFADNGQLNYRILFDRPLAFTSRAMVPVVRKAFAELRKEHPSDLDLNDLVDPSIFLP